MSKPISPQGYVLGGEPYADNPFWDGDAPAPEAKTYVEDVEATQEEAGDFTKWTFSQAKDGKKYTVATMFVPTSGGGGGGTGEDGATFTPKLTPDKTGYILSWTNDKGKPNPTPVQILNGEKGATGATGPQGPKGDPGETGATGPRGPVGETGPQGPQGEPGATGATGATGPEGPQGPEGPAGPQGPQGPEGPAGETGPAGPQGEPGKDAELPAGNANDDILVWDATGKQWLPDGHFGEMLSGGTAGQVWTKTTTGEEWADPTGGGGGGGGILVETTNIDEAEAGVFTISGPYERRTTAYKKTNNSFSSSVTTVTFTIQSQRVFAVRTNHKSAAGSTFAAFEGTVGALLSIGGESMPVIGLRACFYLQGYSPAGAPFAMAVSPGIFTTPGYFGGDTYLANSGDIMGTSRIISKVKFYKFA